jgi:23S rRNA pseudouridine2605 synthase
VEAVAGAPGDAPGDGSLAREVIENATAMLHRLTADGSVVPLNLFNAGAFGSGAGAPAFGGVDQPDFVVTRDALPFVFSLIGGRNWKSGPGAKASPLMTEIWTLLNGHDAMTAQEIQTALGRELTEAAVLRALAELWNGLRAIPVYGSNETKWELTQARFAAEMTASQKVAQTTALSTLMAMYLEAVVAASSEEIETFLSPLAARSRVREVVNGLQATRQLGMVSAGAHPLFHVVGLLPEFAEEPVKADETREVVERGGTEPRARFEGRPRFEKRGADFERRPREERAERGGERPERRPFERGERGRADREGGRPYRKPFEQERRAEGRGQRFDDRERRPSGKKPFEGERERFGKKRYEGERGGFRERPFEKKEKRFEARPFKRRERFDGERSRAGGERREGRDGKFPPKKFGRGGERRPWQDRGERREFERPSRGEGRFRSREGERGEQRPEKFGAAKKYGDGKKFGGQQRFRERGSAGGFERGQRPFFGRRRAEGESHSREGGEGSRFERRTGGWKANSERRGSPRQGKPEFRGAGKAGFKKSGFGTSGPPFGKSGKGSGKSAKPFGKSGKGSGKSAKPFGKSGKPGGFKPPLRKRKDRRGGNGGSESGE